MSDRFEEGYKEAEYDILKLLDEVLEAYKGIDFDEHHKEEREKLEAQHEQAVTAIEFCISWLKDADLRKRIRTED
tara:strand:- start:288 stop:512 length:225 start_codon:yes stop_codon:yes gene_type:complete